MADGLPIDMKAILAKVVARKDLTRAEASGAFEWIMSQDATPALVGAFLAALASKGIATDELYGAAYVMREKAVFVPVEGPALDTCGTGGDVKGTFNISTAAALIAAAAGVHVVKHGNRSATSKSGSADALEKLGVRIDLDPSRLSRCLEYAGICFAFARNHHPAMKYVSPIRSELGIPTIFNLLGPLTNPGRTKFQLLGVFRPDLTEPIARVLRDLGSSRAWVVHANDGLDEISTMGPTRISELKEGEIRTWELDPRTLGILPPDLAELKADSVETSAEMVFKAISGGPSPMRDIAQLNAAAALTIMGISPDMPSAWTRAGAAIESGAARKTLERLIEATR